MQYVARGNVFLSLHINHYKRYWETMKMLEIHLISTTLLDRIQVEIDDLHFVRARTCCIMILMQNHNILSV